LVIGHSVIGYFMHPDRSLFRQERMRLPFSFLLICWFINLSASAQVNLVPNPSFEDTLSCPTIPGFDIASTKFWTAYRGSPDFFHPCANNGPFFPWGNPVLGVPLNRGGHQFPIHGDSYGGLYTYQGQNGSNLREFMGTILTTDLIIGTQYFFSCFVSNGDSVESNASTDNFGMRLSTIPYNTNLGLTMAISNSSIIKFDSIVMEKSNWVRLSGSFVSDSAYRFLAIGNFYSDSNTQVDSTPGTNPLAYYYVDAVCLTTDSLYNELWTGSLEIAPKPKFKIFPNPTEDYFFVDFYDRVGLLTVMDVSGRIYYSQKLVNGSNNIDVKNLTPDLYFILIDNRVIQKIIKM
jgi:hypothetical protein